MVSGAKEKIIVALDVPHSAAAFELADQLAGIVGWVKIGLQLFTAEGPHIVREAKERGFRVFLDLKFHDIPNTVQGAVRSACNLGADMTSIHLSGGRKMVKAAVDAASDSDLLILGITVLTSLDEGDLQDIGISRGADAQVRNLVQLGAASGLRGVVCSPLEVRSLRARFEDSLVIVTPGVRPANAEKSDQRRVMTPADAIRSGASYLVIGRPITEAPSPAEAARHIVEEVAAAGKSAGID